MYQCGRCNEVGHDDDHCPHFPHGHPAWLGGDYGERVQEVQFLGRRRVRINGVEYEHGAAASTGCNCLIDALRQRLGLEGGADLLARVRDALRREFGRARGPQRVKADNYLEFSLHWRAAARYLLEATGHDPREVDRLRVVCLDDVRRDNVDVEGEGDRVLHFISLDGNHFVPLWPTGRGQQRPLA